MKKLLWAILFVFVAIEAFAQTPHHEAIVRDVAGQFALGTPDGLAAFVDASVCALHAVDNRWGQLRKSGGTHIHGHAHDGALYLSDIPGQSQFVDYVIGAGAANASIGWSLDTPRYSRSDWLTPHNCGPSSPPPPAPVDLSAVLAKLDALSNQIAAMSLQIEAVSDRAESARVIAQDARNRIEDTYTTLDLVRHQINRPPLYVGKFWGFNITLRPSIHPANAIP